MKPIYELVGIAERFKTKGEFGVEIEVEGRNLPTDLKGWRIEKDGSLKAEEAYEYVMPKPTSIEGVRAALDKLEQAYVDFDSRVDNSIRAGVHVHMNVQDWDIKRVLTFATVYFILEDVLVRWCGENREGNLFCLRTGDAEGVLFLLQKALAERNLRHLDNEDIRYCSLNFLSLFKYGSLEFRSMRSTPELDAIYEWVEIIKELRDSSSVFDNPADAIFSMSGGGEAFFLERMLPTKHKLFTYPGYERAIRSACRRIQMLAFTIDWDDLARPNNNPFIQAKGF